MLCRHAGLTWRESIKPQGRAYSRYTVLVPVLWYTNDKCSQKEPPPLLSSPLLPSPPLPARYSATPLGTLVDKIGCMLNLDCRANGLLRSTIPPRDTYLTIVVQPRALFRKRRLVDSGKGSLGKDEGSNSLCANTHATHVSVPPFNVWPARAGGACWGLGRAVRCSLLGCTHPDSWGSGASE